MTEKDRGEGNGSQKVAVALQYDGKETLPRLTAKGRGDVAARIVELAEASGVHVEYNEPLAESLSRLELEQQNSKGALPRRRRSDRICLEKIRSGRKLTAQMKTP